MRKMLLSGNWTVSNYDPSKIVVITNESPQKLEELDFINKAVLVNTESPDSEYCQFGDDGEGYWKTSCGNFWEAPLKYDTPSEYGMNFCMYCGKPIKEVVLVKCNECMFFCNEKCSNHNSEWHMSNVDGRVSDCENYAFNWEEEDDA